MAMNEASTLVRIHWSAYEKLKLLAASERRSLAMQISILVEQEMVRREPKETPAS